jgi:hypothetical protein
MVVDSESLAERSGKRFSMLFYAGRIVRHPAMQNPALVVLTDRNDLDDQLFGQFQRCHELPGADARTRKKNLGCLKRPRWEVWIDNPTTADREAFGVSERLWCIR